MFGSSFAKGMVTEMVNVHIQALLSLVTWKAGYSSGDKLMAA